ncbi:MAG: transketolase [Planctomycetota bacterium]
MPQPTLETLRPCFPYFDKIKDLIDQCIDLMLNHRQSGHPGGSRSKVYPLIMTTIGGFMRWDVREPGKRFGDRFVLVAGHTNPVVYAMLAVYHEALRERYRRTGDAKYLVKGGAHRAVTWEDLLKLRRRGGLPGHAECEGKTLFFKFNTGPSGHGSPAAAGQALALKHAGCDEVKVWAFEGEGGMTAGATHETKNSAFGLGLSNLVYVVDWNDYGIDDVPISSVVNGTPEDWFKPYGWRVSGCANGEDWSGLARAFVELCTTPNPDSRPGVVWVKNRKGRGYGVFDNKSHGTPHKKNSPAFWETKRVFAEKYGVSFVGFGEPAPDAAGAHTEQTAENLKRVMAVLHRDEALLGFLADRLVEIGDSVPATIASCKIDGKKSPLKDPGLLDYQKWPADLYLKAGEKAPNRAALAKVGSFLNAYGRKHYGRPLFLVCSADLAESTNIAGFAHDYGDAKGYGWYDRKQNVDGALLPQEITEFTNAGIMCGITCVNFAENPEQDWIGYMSACSTYGSFSYLKYGLMRLFSQLAQDSQLQVGKVIWVAGHSGPETAEDFRTHFGVFAPGVTQLFPEGLTLNLHPWEYNEVAPVIGAALNDPAHVIALHLTRPPVTIPDREALGIPSHLHAARGAYVLRDFDPSRRKDGVVIVQGTSPVSGIVKLLPDLKNGGPNVKIIAAISPELFKRQPAQYREHVLPWGEWLDSMCITNGARRLMHDWLPHKIAEEYTLSSDWDDRWRTGGSVEEVLEEAHLSPDWLMRGIERFATDREARLARLATALDQLRAPQSVS